MLKRRDTQICLIATSLYLLGGIYFKIKNFSVTGFTTGRCGGYEQREIGGNTLFFLADVMLLFVIVIRYEDKKRANK